MTEDNLGGIRVSKRCPYCGWRVLDKVTATSGIIELKCPRCGRSVKIDLSFRMALTHAYQTRV